MLNISKLSKMLLISGLVLAFSCVTLNVDYVYAQETQENQSCAKAKKELKKELETEIDLTAETAAYEQAKKDKVKAGSQEGLIRANQGVHSAAYQSAKLKYDNAVKEEAKAKKALDKAKKEKEESKKQAVINAQAAVAKACTKGKGVQDADDKTDSANQYASDKKEKQDAVNQAQKAVDQRNREREAHFNEHGEYDIFAEIEDSGQTDRNLSQKQQDLANHNSQSQKTKKQQKAADNSASAKKKANAALDDAINKQNLAYEEWNDAEINFSNALKEQEKWQEKVTDTQIKMQQACASNHNSQECKDAQTAYAEASNSLQGAKKSFNDAKDIYDYAIQLKDEAEQSVDIAARDKQNADKADKKRAQQAVNDAQAKVDRFCTPGKSYNKRKCEKATEELTSAKADDTYMGMEEEKKNTQKFKNDQEDTAKKNADTAIGKDPSKAADAYITSGDLKALEDQQNSIKDSVSKEEAKLNKLEAAREAACSKRMKSKACDEAQQAYEDQKRQVDSLKTQQATIDKQLTGAKDTQAKVNLQIAECKKTPDKPECLELLAKHNDDNLSQAKEGMQAAKTEKMLADEAYKNALNAEALLCNPDPTTEECTQAKGALQEAKTRKENANSAFVEATGKSATASSAQIESLKRQQAAACEKAKTKTFDAITDTLAKNECDDLTKEVKEAEKTALEDKIKAYCTFLDEDPESDDEFGLADDANPDCRQAHKALKAFNEQEAIAAAAKARADREKEAEKICAKYGKDSPECFEATHRIGTPDSNQVAQWTRLERVREKGFEYSTESGDVFEMVTRRVAFIILNIKPFVYMLAGFGLIAFAWGAIFNKISWRHFAYIAIGLFLVANMGRLIEFVVTNKNSSGHFIGQWNEGNKSQSKSDVNKLSKAFVDTYDVFGYVMVDPEEVNSGEVSVSQVAGGDLGGSGAIADITQKRKYCQGTSGSGWGNFKSCMNDIVGSIKGFTSMVRGAVDTVKGVAHQVRVAKDATINISNAIKALKNADSVSDVFDGLANITGNIQKIGNAGLGVIDQATSGVNDILDGANDVVSTHDGGERKRATEMMQDAFMNLGAAAGDVEDLVGTIKKENEARKQGKGIYGGPESVYGEGGFGGFGGKKGSPAKKTGSSDGSSGGSSDLAPTESAIDPSAISGKINSAKAGKPIDSTQITAEKVAAVGEAPAPRKAPGAGKGGGEGTATGDSGLKAVVHTSQEEYNNAIQKTNGLYKDVQNQEKEINNLKNKMAQAQKAADKACAEGSALCEVYKAQVDGYNAMVTASETKLEETKKSYETAKSKNDKLYEEMLDTNIQTAAKEAEKLAGEAEKACKKDATSSECVKALGAYNDAQTKHAKALEEKEKNTKASYKETTEQKQGTDNSANYKNAVDNVNDLYKQEKAKNQEIETVKEEISKIDKQLKENNCTGGSTSDICKALQGQKSSLEGYQKEQEKALKQIQDDKSKAKAEMDSQHEEFLQKNVESAEKARDEAQKEADNVCKDNNNSQACLKARNKVIEAINNVTKAKDEQTGKGNKTQTEEEKEAERKRAQDEKEREKALEEYERRTNSEKAAEDLKRTYSELEKETETAKSSYEEKQQKVKAAKKAYEEAKAKADESGSKADAAEAKRLEKEFEDSQKEAKKAKDNYEELNSRENRTKAYYLERAIKAEQEKQAEYEAEMSKLTIKAASLEGEIVAKRKEAEEIAEKIMKLGSSEEMTDDEKIAALQLRKEYDIAKAQYSQMKNELSRAKNDHKTLSNRLAESVAYLKELEEQLEALIKPKS